MTFPRLLLSAVEFYGFWVVCIVVSWALFAGAAWLVWSLVA